MVELYREWCKENVKEEIVALNVSVY